MPVDPAPGPSFLVIGAGRSGTTLLCHQLSRHPEIRITDPKEPHFLAFPGQALDFRGPGDDVTINRRAVTDPGRWRALFDERGEAGGRRVWGEGSVSTLYYAERSVATIQHHCPDVRLIAVLRDPVERAWSAHQYLAGRGYETEPFDRALDEEDGRRSSGWHHLWHYVAMGRYAQQLQPFVDTFGPDRVLVLDYAQLANEPRSAIGTCHAFLGVAAMRIEDQLPLINASTVPRSQVVAAGMRRLTANDRARNVVRGLLPLSVRERLRRITSSPPASLPEACRARLDETFHEERRQLRELLGADAPGWVGVTA